MLSFLFMLLIDVNINIIFLLRYCLLESSNCILLFFPVNVFEICSIWLLIIGNIVSSNYPFSNKRIIVTIFSCDDAVGPQYNSANACGWHECQFCSSRCYIQYYNLHGRLPNYSQFDCNDNNQQ